MASTVGGAAYEDRVGSPTAGFCHSNQAAAAQFEWAPACGPATSDDGLKALQLRRLAQCTGSQFQVPCLCSTINRVDPRSAGNSTAD